MVHVPQEAAVARLFHWQRWVYTALHAAACEQCPSGSFALRGQANSSCLHALESATALVFLQLFAMTLVRRSSGVDVLAPGSLPFVTPPSPPRTSRSGLGAPSGDPPWRVVLHSLFPWPSAVVLRPRPVSSSLWGLVGLCDVDTTRPACPANVGVSVVPGFTTPMPRSCRFCGIRCSRGSLILGARWGDMGWEWLFLTLPFRVLRCCSSLRRCCPLCQLNSASSSASCTLPRSSVGLCSRLALPLVRWPDGRLRGGSPACWGPYRGPGGCLE